MTDGHGQAGGTGKRRRGLLGVVGKNHGADEARARPAPEPTGRAVGPDQFDGDVAGGRPTASGTAPRAGSNRPQLPVVTAPPTVAAPRRFSQSIARYATVGMLACLLLVFGVGGWAAIARISSAVIAGGQVVVASNVKKVQHPEGGIVGDIYVKNGDVVKAGQTLIRLDETLTKANREVIDSQLVALEARLARLRAERDGASEITIPASLKDQMDSEDVQQAVESQRKVFTARAETINGQIERLSERTAQLRQQIEGDAAQRDAKEREIALIKDELVDLETLLAKGHVPKTRVMALKRETARLEGEHGEFTSRIAMTEGRINETQLEVLSLKQDFLEKVYSEITEIEPQVANLKERRIAADFQLQRTDIVAPHEGIINNLAIHTVGGVIQPGQTIMEIVPGEDQLLVEVQISTRDIDQVMVGQEANVVMSAFDRRTAPTLHGKVTFRGADRLVDEHTGISYYVAQVTLDDGEIDKLDKGLTLVPGMPAEVYISTGERTVIDYLTRPLTDQFRRTMRQG